MAHRRLTIMIVPHSHKRIREITVSQRALTVAGAMLAGAILMSVVYAIGFHIRGSQEKRLEAVKQENAQLTSRLRDISGSLVSLKTEMDDLNRKEEVLRVMANLPPADSEARLMGIGGTAEDETPVADDLMAHASRLGLRVHASIAQLLRQAEFQRQNFEQLERAFNDSIEYRDHLPSIWPVPRSQVYISSHFGYRIDPYTGRRAFHKGVDFAGRTGTPVMATANGIVSTVAVGSYIGNVIEIDHLYGLVTVYGHLSKVFVRKGQRVVRGQVIGEMGNTGRSTGPHLHYSILYNGRAVDPENYFVVSRDVW